MKILITGNMGYVGPGVVQRLRKKYPEAEIVGYDTGFFAHNLSTHAGLPEVQLSSQHFGDIRYFPEKLLAGVNLVIHLAAISNDPIGQQFETVTNAINGEASVAIAKAAQKAGVERFVFASSCSMYGATEGGARTETDKLNPLTAYARSKVRMEQELAELASETFLVTNLRFATACGMSPRLRLDLVLNDFVACALSSGTIEILSDGTPWRPLIDVQDMARAIDWAGQRTLEVGGPIVSVNVGRTDWNYQIKDLAQMVAEEIPGTQVIISGSPGGDKRSYKVDFSLFEKLAPDHIPQVPVQESIRNLYEGMRTIGFDDSDFRNSNLIRLKSLQKHLGAGRLNADLFWQV